VLGARVLTDTGAEVGVVLDVVVEGGISGRVAGFLVSARDAVVPGARRRRRKVYLPRGETLAVSGRALVIPGDATRFVADDLTEFADQVAAYRVRDGKEVLP